MENLLILTEAEYKEAFFNYVDSRIRIVETGGMQYESTTTMQIWRPGRVQRKALALMWSIAVSVHEGDGIYLFFQMKYYLACGGLLYYI